MSKESRKEIYSQMLEGKYPGITVMQGTLKSVEGSGYEYIVEGLQKFDGDYKNSEVLAEGYFSKDVSNSYYSKVNEELRAENITKNAVQNNAINIKNTRAQQTL